MVAPRKPGEVRDAIVRYLSNIMGDASVREICAAVREEFGEPVAGSSVRSYLRLNSPPYGSTFLHTNRGRYRLVRK